MLLPFFVRPEGLLIAYLTVADELLVFGPLDSPVVAIRASVSPCPVFVVPTGCTSITHIMTNTVRLSQL